MHITFLVVGIELFFISFQDGHKVYYAAFQGYPLLTGHPVYVCEVELFAIKHIFWMFYLSSKRWSEEEEF